MKYDESIKFSRYVIENDISNSHYSAHATLNICNCHYYLGDYKTSMTFLDDYKKYSFSFVEDNVKFITGCINGKTGNVELGIKQLEGYLKAPSDFNLVYAVTTLMDLYLIKHDFKSAKKLLEHVPEMEESIKDKRTTPDKKARLAFFYQLVGNVLIIEDDEKAFDYYLKSALEYMRIGLYENALGSIIIINDVIIENPSRYNIGVIRKKNALYKQIVNKKLD